MPNSRILVVEDEAIVARDIQKRLRSLGYIIPAVAHTGVSAVAKATELVPDLVLMDIRLKGDMDGIEAAEEIKSKNNIPIVYLTAYSDDETLKRAKISEPFGYLVKPFEIKELKTTIEIALFKHSLEQKLRESEERFRLIADFTNDWEYWIDSKGDLIYTSPSCIRITGYASHEFSSNSKLMMQIVHPEDKKSYEAHFNLVCRDLSDAHELEFRIINKNNQVRWLEHLCQPVYSSKGQYLGRRVSNRDITQRKEALEAREQSDNRSRAIISALPDTVMQLSADMIITDINIPTPNTIFTFENIVPGKNINEIGLSAETLKITLENINNAFILECIQTFEFDIIASDIKTSFEARAVPCGKGEILCIIRDVTEFRMAEIEREKLISDLQAAIKKIKVLSGLVPICSQCRKVRDDKGFWNSLEKYVAAHSDAVFSHGLCPECYVELYPEYPIDDEED